VKVPHKGAPRPCEGVVKPRRSRFEGFACANKLSVPFFQSLREQPGVHVRALSDCNTSNFHSVNTHRIYAQICNYKYMCTQTQIPVQPTTYNLSSDHAEADRVSDLRIPRPIHTRKQSCATNKNARARNTDLVGMFARAHTSAHKLVCVPLPFFQIVRAFLAFLLRSTSYHIFSNADDKSLFLQCPSTFFATARRRRCSRTCSHHLRHTFERTPACMRACVHACILSISALTSVAVRSL